MNLYFSMVLFAGFLSSFFLVTGATAQGVPAVSTWSSGESPDIALEVKAGPADPTRTEGTVADALRNLEGVAAVAVVPTDSATSIVYVTASADVDGDLVERVEVVASAAGPEATVVGGQGAEDVRLRALIDRQALTAVAIVILLCTACLALVYGWQFGLGVLVVLGGVAGIAGFVNGLVGVGFDGSILSTSLPATLSSFVVVSIIGYRIIHEVEETKPQTSPVGAIVEAFHGLGRPVAWMLGQLMLAAGLVAILIGSSSSILSVLIGAVTGSLVGLTVVPILVDRGQVSFSRPSGRLRSVLSDHDLGNTVKLSVGVLVMIIVGVGVANSLGQASTAVGSPGLSGDRRVSSIGIAEDLTRSIAVRLPEASSDDSAAIAKEISSWPSVAAVQTGEVRATKGEVQSNDEAGLVSVFESLSSGSDQTVFVVPMASSGREAVNTLATRLDSEDLVAGSVVEPSRLATARATAHQGWLLVVLVALFGLYGLAIALPGLHLGGGLASVVAARLLVVLAVIGFSSFLVRSGATDEVVLIVVLTMMLWAWMEASLGVTITTDVARGQGDAEMSWQASRLKSRTPIRSASLGLALLAMSGATLLYSSAGFLRPLGRVLVVVSLVLAAVITVIVPAFYRMLASNHAEYRSEENLMAVARDVWLGRPRSLPSFSSLVSVPMSIAGAGLGRFTRQVQSPRTTAGAGLGPRAEDVDVDVDVDDDDDVDIIDVNDAKGDVDASTDVDGVEDSEVVADGEVEAIEEVDGAEGGEVAADDEVGEVEAIDVIEEVDGAEGGEVVADDEVGEVEAIDGGDAGVEVIDADDEVDDQGDDADVVDAEGEAPEQEADSNDRAPVSIRGFSSLEAVGLGGFAVVYRAVDGSGREVAVKVLKDVGDGAEQRRFEREKEALQALDGVEGVVDLVGSGVTAQGAPYLTTPYFERGTVARTLKEHPFTWHRSYEISCQLAETLEQCHERRIYHRDLKPSNVLLDKQNRPHLLDFGSTQIVDGRSLSTRAAFTPNYCPPEVLIEGNMGSDAALIDVYGLGILIWAMIAGRRPFVADEDDANEVPTVFNRVATEALPPLENVPHWLGSVVEKATEKNPNHRFESMASMRVALRTRSVQKSQETRRNLSQMFRRRMTPDDELRRNRASIGARRSETEEQKQATSPAQRSDQLDEQYLDITEGLPLDQTAKSDRSALKEPETDTKETLGSAAAEPTGDGGTYLPTIRLTYPAGKQPVEKAVPTSNPKPDEKLQTLNLSAVTPPPDNIDWKGEVSALIDADFDLASLPSEYSIDSAYVPDTEIYRAAEKHRDHYLRWGQKIRGDRPKVLSVKLLNRASPTRVEVVVDHPEHRLIGQHGDTIEHFPGETRKSVLWLVETDQGFRISAIVLASSHSR